eukprot:SRR837773.17305.p1 GENE.SRR837773.17305~~SRR837773.17305.p1  ORF type:complete len:588 (-),score=206.36 SRR837773.17305:31-1671(-)
MVANAVRGDCACHHVLVKEEDGQLHGIISSHDLVAAFRRHDMWKHLIRDHLTSLPESLAPPDAEEEMAGTSVADIMKPRDHVFACVPSDSLRAVLKILLVTQQNFLMVAGQKGIYGFATPRDLVKAFADAVPLETSISDYLKTRPSERTHRTILSDAPVIKAAEDMTRYEVDHLIVVRPSDGEAVGIVSSLDVVLHTKAKGLVLETPSWSGPSIGEVLKEHTTQTAMCTESTTLAVVCGRLVAAGQTSVMVGQGAEPRGLLTEADLVRAFVNQYTKSMTVGDVLDEFGEHPVPAYLQVAPSMHLTEAGSLLLQGLEPGRACHHLVVRAVTGSWLGIFSALDVVRALCHLSSKLDAAKLGLDVLEVRSVMKPAEAVPKCVTTETLRDVLSQFQEFCQNAAIVMEGTMPLGLITPRCALHGLADDVVPSITVGEWMRTRQLPEGPREVLPNMPLMQAAALMTQYGLHHLLVVEELGGAPVGVLSTLDIVRGIVSTHQRCPFLTLSWLRHVGVPTSFAPEDRAVRPEKRLPEAEAWPAAKARRVEECGA